MLMTTLPPPFNIIPTFAGFQTITEYVKVLVKPPPNKRARWDFMQCCYIVSSVELHVTLYGNFKRDIFQGEREWVQGLRKVKETE